MNTIQKIKYCKEKIALLRQEQPDFIPYISINKQLDYLMDVVNTKKIDPIKLNHITLGILAVREIADIDQPLAEVLYELDSYAEQLLGKNNSNKLRP